MAGARASSCRLSGTPARRGHRTTRVVPSRPLRRVSLQFSRQSSLHRASNEKGNNGNVECDVSSMSSTNSSITAMMQASVPMTQKKTKKMATISTTVGALSMLTMMYPLDALAKGGELGLLEGRSFALVHPLIMGVLLAVTAYSGVLGLKWRRQRTIGDDISKLKEEIKAVESAIPALADGSTDMTGSGPGRQVAVLNAKIDELKAQRSKLGKEGNRDKHFNVGSLLLGAGVVFSIEGGMNTYIRVGKLFPGPHLYAGLGITALWAASAALVPAMQKGDENARVAHISMNVVNMGLFLWQVPTGLEIVGKVFQFTSWP